MPSPIPTTSDSPKPAANSIRRHLEVAQDLARLQLRHEGGRDARGIAHHHRVDQVRSGGDLPDDEKRQRPDDAEDELLAARRGRAGRWLPRRDADLAHRSRLQGAIRLSRRRNSVTKRKPKVATTTTSTKISAARSLVE